MLLILLLCATVLARWILQRVTAHRITIAAPTGIHSLEQVSLGGVQQWIQIRGWDRRKPFLLFLHGGPGFPQMPFAHQNADLEKDFIVVQWDQLGAGKSYSPNLSNEQMRIDRFVADAKELVELLSRRFDQRKCYLVAHSWGSIVGAKLVAEQPELFAAYIAIGQVALPPESQQVRYRFALGAAREAGNAEAVRELEEAGAPPYGDFDKADRLEHWVERYAQQDYTPPSPMRFTWLALASPAYSWIDLIRIPLGAKFSFARLWRESFYDVNLFEQVPKIDVPVFFFTGRHDMVVTTEVVEEYFDALDAPRGKEMVWFEDSGHWPHFREPVRYRAALRHVLDVTKPE